MAYVVLRVERRWREIQISYVREEETGKREREPNLFYPGFSFQFWKKFDFLCFKRNFFMFLHFLFFYLANKQKNDFSFTFLYFTSYFLQTNQSPKTSTLKTNQSSFLSKRSQKSIQRNLAGMYFNFFFQPNKKMKEQNSINNLLKINSYFVVENSYGFSMDCFQLFIYPPWFNRIPNSRLKESGKKNKNLGKKIIIKLLEFPIKKKIMPLSFYLKLMYDGSNPIL